MNARKFLNVRVSLTVTALALSGALVFSAMTTSCASSNSGGSGGNGSGGSGGGTGGTTGGGNCADPASDAVNFCNGKAQGVMTGYAYIALGKQDTATDPVCAPDSADMTTTRPITSADNSPSGACPTTGTTVWNTSDALCISGTIPTVTGGDYTSNWGLQIGVNTIDPPATSAGSGTLGKTYATIAATTTGDVTPTNSAIRLVIHLVGTPDTDNPYCATVSGSGKAITLTSFNTQCWNGSSCGAVPACTPGADQSTCCNQLKDTDIPNIDKIGIQISSDNKQPYAVNNFCLTGYQFGN
jgi:hypothetical protein